MSLYVYDLGGKRYDLEIYSSTNSHMLEAKQNVPLPQWAKAISQHCKRNWWEFKFQQLLPWLIEKDYFNPHTFTESK